MAALPVMMFMSTLCVNEDGMTWKIDLWGTKCGFHDNLEFVFSVTSSTVIAYSSAEAFGCGIIVNRINLHCYCSIDCVEEPSK